jgi:hypothetical protein
LKKPLAARCGVENRLELLTYCRVRSAFESVFALHRIHQRLSQQPTRLTPDTFTDRFRAHTPADGWIYLIDIFDPPAAKT